MLSTLIRAACFVLVAAVALPAAAQQWPTKPVRLVVPFPPGGSVDPLARLLGTKLSELLGQQFIVENKPGASGSIGTAFAAKSPPDGYTFVFVFDTHAVNPTLIPNLPFDTAKDLVPVMLVGTAPMAIATNASKPYKNFGDVVKAAKAKPDSVTFGSIGNGSLGHLTMILVQQAAGVKLVHVPYKGGGPMTAGRARRPDRPRDRLGGGARAARQGREAARDRRHRRQALARRCRTCRRSRSRASRASPRSPGGASSRRPGHRSRSSTSSMRSCRRCSTMPDVRKTLTETLGMDIVAASPEATQKFLLGEMARWGKVVKDNNIKPD